MTTTDPSRPTGPETAHTRGTHVLTHITRAIGALLITLTGALALTSPAHAEPAPPNVATLHTECGADLTFANPTGWMFSFDYRIDNEQPTADVEPELADLLIKEGPLKGEPFGPRYQVVTLEAGETATETITFTPGPHTVAYQLRRGAEQLMYLDWIELEFDIPAICKVEPTPTPEATPTTEPTTEPTTSPAAEPTTTEASTPPAASVGLPVTGASTPMVAGIGAITIGAGLGLLLVRRRKRTRFEA